MNKVASSVVLRFLFIGNLVIKEPATQLLPKESISGRCALSLSLSLQSGSKLVAHERKSGISASEMA